MSVVTLRVLPGRTFQLAYDDEANLLPKVAIGECIQARLYVRRNLAFHKKWFALVKYAFDVWTEHAPPMTMLGHRAQPNFDVFRKNLTVLAGFYEPVYQLDGTLRLEAKSIAWNRMEEPEFAQLYDKTIDAIIDNVAGMQGMTVQQVKEVVDETLRFA